MFAITEAVAETFASSVTSASASIPATFAESVYEIFAVFATTLTLLVTSASKSVISPASNTTTPTLPATDVTGADATLTFIIGLAESVLSIVVLVPPTIV